MHREIGSPVSAPVALAESMSKSGSDISGNGRSGSGKSVTVISGSRRSGSGRSGNGGSGRSGSGRSGSGKSGNGKSLNTIFDIFQCVSSSSLHFTVHQIHLKRPTRPHRLI